MLSSDDNTPHVDTPGLPTGQFKQSSPDLQNIPYKTKNDMNNSHTDLQSTRLFLQSIEPEELTFTIFPNEIENVVNNLHVDSPGYCKGVTLYTPVPSQATLSEPLYKCRLGWYYSPERTTCKRTGLSPKKKPTYRYEKTISGNEAWQLGRYIDDSSIPLENFLLFSPKRTRDLVVFIPTELWSQYPNQQSWTKPPQTITGPAAVAVLSAGSYTYDTEIEIEHVSSVYPADLGTIQIDLLNTKPADTKPVNNDINNLHVDTTGRLSIWQRFVNWLNA